MPPIDVESAGDQRIRPRRVALTGGIAAGKSQVLRLLSAAGAFVIDADDVAREAVQPGSPGLDDVIREFGAGVQKSDGQLDRGALAAIIFADEDARRRLEALLHPRIRELAYARMAAAPPQSVVVYAVPLLVETASAADFDVVVTVEAPAELRVARLVGSRGMSESQARARIAAQADETARRSVADIVIDNSGTPESLAGEVARLWSWLTDSRSQSSRPS